MALGALAGVAQACLWTNVTFLPTDDVTACLKAIPFNAEWRDGTVRSLTALLENFVFKDAVTDTGPPADLRVQLMAELEKIGSTEYENDAAMESAFAKLMMSVHDGHTVYYKCDAYYPVYYTQPWKLRVAADGANEKILLGGEARPGLFDHLGGVYPSLEGLEVISIDGAAPITTLTNWAKDNVPQSADVGVQFNVLLMASYFTTRRLLVHDIPEEPMRWGLRNSSSQETIEIEVPWQAVNRYAPATIEISAAACAASPRGERADARSERSRPYQMALEGPELRSLEAPKGWPLVLSNDDNLALYISEDNSTGVIKLLDFSPNNYTAFCEYTRFSLTALAERKVQNLVVDVLGNGGGYVCLGYNFLRLLVPELLDAPPSVYQAEYDLPWVEAISAAIRDNATAREYFGLDEYIDAATGEFVTDQPAFYDDGKTSLVGDVPDARRTKRFFLDCDDQSPPDFACDLSPPSMTFSAAQMLVLTDGYCGSTCSTFMHRLQAGAYARVAGVGGIKHLPMESNSFAGGFTSNVNQLNAVLQGSDQIPAYPTNGGVYGFAQAEVYDYGRRDTPSQYAWSGTDLRFDFWDFQGDLAPLYNMAKATFRDQVSV